MHNSYVYNVGQAFGKVVDRFGDRPALRFAGGLVVSYGELDAHANRVARMLVQRGLRRGDVLGIVHTKTVRCYAAMLASLKVGAAYVNLDDQNPAPRLSHIFSTARPKIVVAETPSEAIMRAAHDAGATLIDLTDPGIDREVAASSEAGIDNLAAISGRDPAYIMYTSGSTGVPKGALITHANVLNFGAWCGERFEIQPDDILTNVNPMYFDNSVFDFYGALLNGASLAPITREVLSDPARLVMQIEEAACTTWFSVPSLLIYLTTLRLLSPDRLRTVRQFVFGGEGYPKPELRKLLNTYGKRSRLINVYGPTECTCICSAWNVREEDLEDANVLVTLGPVAENFSALVLNGDDDVAPGEVGELCLLGPQVGLGYINDSQRTEKSFVANPTQSAWQEPMYRTGDLVRLDADGRKLHFVGRADNQIKHMGYRIELEEIEAALNRLPDVTQSAVVQKNARAGMKILVAYVAANGETTEQSLRDGLDRLLPPYMVPQRFYIRSTLPKNANGKIDRVALKNE